MKKCTHLRLAATLYLSYEDMAGPAGRAHCDRALFASYWCFGRSPQNAKTQNTHFLHLPKTQKHKTQGVPEGPKRKNTKRKGAREPITQNTHNVICLLTITPNMR